MRIAIHCDAKGRERAAFGDTEADSLTALARALVSAGVPDQPWTAGWASGGVSLFGPSLHRLACLDAQDDDRRTGWRWHAPSPFKPPDPILAAVLDTAKQARARIPCRVPAAAAE